MFALHLNKGLPLLSIHSPLPSSAPLHILRPLTSPHRGFWEREVFLCWSPWEKLLLTWHRWMADPPGGQEAQARRVPQRIKPWVFTDHYQTAWVRTLVIRHWNVDLLLIRWWRKEFRSLQEFSLNFPWYCSYRMIWFLPAFSLTTNLQSFVNNQPERR